MEDTRPLKEGETFSDMTIIVSNNRWRNCTFVECKLIANGPVDMEDCDLSQADLIGTNYWPRALYDGVRNVWPHPEDAPESAPMSAAEALGLYPAASGPS